MSAELKRVLCMAGEAGQLHLPNSKTLFPIQVFGATTNAYWVPFYYEQALGASGLRKYGEIVCPCGASADAPTQPALNDMFYDTDVDRMLQWSANGWVDTVTGRVV